MTFFQSLGFKNHPFAQTNADEEPFLKDYFVSPPFFDAVIGDSDSPNACIVFAPRGAGKSAQRRMVEMWAAKNEVLAVTYDRFEFGVGQQVEDIGLPYHLRNIIIRVLIAYLSFLADYPRLLVELNKRDRQTLSLFIHNYIGDMTGNKLQEILGELRTLPQKIRDFWSKNVGFLESVINVLLKKYGLEKIDLPDIDQEERRLDSSYKHQLETLLDVVRPIGHKSIYILIDKLDESEKTGNDPEKTYRLIQPLVKDLELLGITGYGFKLFVWDKVLPLFRKDARPDRITQHALSWTRKNLEAVLSARLSAFSDRKILSFSQMMDSPSPSYPIDSVLCLLANGSPRNLIRICEKILAVQAERDSTSSCITQNAVEKGILLHCQEIAEELYGEEVCRDLMRTGQELFTINYLANNVFKAAHENTTRNKVTLWRRVDAVKQIGQVTIPSARRPVNFYYVCDPALTRLIHQATPLGQFLNDRWLECPHCGVDNLMNISLVPDGNDAFCYACNRNLLD